MNSLLYVLFIAASLVFSFSMHMRRNVSRYKKPSTEPISVKEDRTIKGNNYKKDSLTYHVDTVQVKKIKRQQLQDNPTNNR